MKKSILLLLLLIFYANNSYAIISIDVDEANISPFKISLISANDNNELSKYIKEVINNDLSNSGFFNVIDQDFYNSNLNKLNEPNFSDPLLSSSSRNLNFILYYSVDNDSSNARIKYKLYNAISKKQIFDQEITLSVNNARKAAHSIADSIYKFATSYDGYFNTKILYINESGPYEKRKKQLAIMDYDGYDNKILDTNRYSSKQDREMLILTPRISSDGEKILFMSYERGVPAVYLFDLNSNRKNLIGNFNGMTSAPRFASNNNDLLLMALSENGYTNIFKYSANERARKQLTNSSSINTSPSYSPDNQFIAFSSDRDSGSQIYIMKSDGSNQKRISNGDGRYYNPVYSPKGDYIAFTKTNKNNFYVGIMRPNGSEEKILAGGYMIESPSWAPNGRLLSFASSSRNNHNNSQLYIVDISGRFHKKISTKESASDPMWVKNN